MSTAWTFPLCLQAGYIKIQSVISILLKNELMRAGGVSFSNFQFSPVACHVLVPVEPVVEQVDLVQDVVGGHGGVGVDVHGGSFSHFDFLVIVSKLYIHLILNDILNFDEKFEINSRSKI